MENQKVFKTPKSILARMQVVHFGKILFNMQFIVLAIMLVSAVSFIMPAIYYLLLVSVLILSFFTLFASPTFMKLWDGGETVTKIATVLTHGWKYTIPIILALSISSIICLCFDKNTKHIGRIVTSAVICVISLIFFIFKIVLWGVVQ